MPTPNVTSCKDKVVLLRVYVEKPKKKRVLSNQNHHHHHHHYHIHQTFRREVVHGTAGKGYDRRAELLRYSQRLRDSARSAPSTPLLSNKQIPNNNQQLTQIGSSQRKPKHSKRPSCFGNWKLIIPGFLRSLTSTKSKKKSKKKQMVSGLSSSQITNVIKKLESQMKRGKSSSLISKVFFSTSRKRC